MASRTRRRAVVSSSRLKGFLSFQELFQNTLRNGWKVIRSGWTAGSSSVSASNPTQYPLLSTTMSKPNVTIEITSPGIGTGAALWVTDSGNWFAVVTSQELSAGSGTCDTYSAINNCGARNACVATGGPYSGSYFVDVGYQCINTYQYQIPNNCTSGTNANNCVAGTNANNCTSGTNANNCTYGTNAGYSYIDNCGYISYSAAYCGYYTLPHQYYDNCKTGGNCKGYGYCLVYGSYYISCCTGYNACVGGYIYWTTQEPNTPCCAPKTINVDGTPNNCLYGSPGTLNNCLYGSPGTPNDCISGSPGTLNNCLYGSPGGTGTANCSCCGRTPQDIRQVNYSGDSYNPCGAGDNCIATGGNCTHYQDTYPRKIKIFKYVSNVLTEIASQTLDSLTSYPVIRSLKVTITNATKGGSTATITTKTYSDLLFTNQIGTDFVHQATGLKINTNYGIIANPSSYNENISVQKVLIS
jgi:hypothetical protein